MKIQIAATKTNFLKVKKDLAVIIEGHELLDEKRRILLNELATVMQTTDSIQEQVQNSLQQAYSQVDKAVVVEGRNKLEGLSFSVDIKSDILISQKRLMGVNIPTIELKIKENPPYYSPYDVSLYVDEVISGFEKILKLLAQLAEKKIAFLRIAAEVRKTIRKVNALEKVYIPLYRETFKYIGDRLDEESRESFSRTKQIKERLKEI
jgi:V/A-type H+-transporting ATPase subunit D